MEGLINYCLKASFGFALFYAIYWLFLQKETFFKANRVFLLSTMIISLVLPLIEVSYPGQTYTIDSSNIFVDINKNFQAITALSIQPENLNTASNWLNGIFLIYITGFIIFLTRLILQSAGLLVVVAKNGIRNISGLKVVENYKYGLPFSFFNIVFINPKFHHGTDLTNILAHEKVHIRENHWFDLFLIEMLTVFFWFNPFVWLFERSIKQNHEYLADEGVLAQGLSVGKYQAILINQLMGMQIIGITNNLNYSINAKRMKMMTKIKTSKMAVLKMIWALPIIALLLLAFAKPSNEVKYEQDQANSADLGKDVRDITIEGKVINEMGQPLEGASIVIMGTSIGSTSKSDGTFDLKIAKTDKFYISYIGYTTIMNGFDFIEQSKKENGIYKPVFKMKTGIINLEIDKMLLEEPPINNKESESIKDNKSDKEQMYVVVEQLPEYPGGMSALAKEISLITKKYSEAKQVKGKVIVGFTVSETGNVVNVQALEKDNDDLAKQAIITISNIKKWNPAIQRGKLVPVNYSIAIKFE